MEKLGLIESDLLIVENSSIIKTFELEDTEKANQALVLRQSLNLKYTVYKLEKVLVL